MAFLIGGTFGFIIMGALLDAIPWMFLWKIFIFIYICALHIILVPLALFTYGLSSICKLIFKGIKLIFKNIFKFLLKIIREESPKEI